MNQNEVVHIMETNLARAVNIARNKAKYDENVKEILADKQILAWILKYTLREFEDEDIENIIGNIDEPEISKVRLEPGYTNSEKIEGTNNEDIVPGEGKIFYDIRFSVYSGSEFIKVLINVEAQKTSKFSKLGYQLDNRIIYYLGRMISSQKEVEFSHSEYDNLKAVRSIWICMDAADDEDSINRIRLTNENVYGKEMELNNIDKVQGVIIRLRDNEDIKESKNILIAMLEELLSKKSADTKKKRLSEDYGLKMSVETERRLGEMCNLSDVLLEKGIEKGKITARFEDGMTIEEIAQKTNVSIDAVEQVLKEEGYLK